MENAITIGLSRQIVLARALEITANNIANQNTAGFKAERTSFQEYLAHSQTVGTDTGREAQFSLVFDNDSLTDFSQGSLIQTNANLDFAITGNGFFAIETENGTRYTRDGHFSLSPFGELVSRDGNPILDTDGSPILLDPQAGPLILSPEGELQQQGTTVARLGIFIFDNLATLRKEGGNLFVATTPATAIDQPSLQQGFIESANVAPIEGITQLIEISRAYTQAAELIETSTELSREAIQTLTETV